LSEDAQPWSIDDVKIIGEREGFHGFLGFLMSDPPVRDIKIYLFLTRINVFVSYSLVISGVGRQHDGEKPRSCDIGC
jgi:hypothetical protein